MMSFNQKLSASGELVGAEGLSGPDQATLAVCSSSACTFTASLLRNSALCDGVRALQCGKLNLLHAHQRLRDPS